MKLKFNFTNPLYVSTYFEKDKIQINVTEELLFLSREETMMLNNNTNLNDDADDTADDSSV